MPLQATSGAASYDAFGGGVPVVPNYIEECFSCFLYTGNGSTQTITNGIDLAGKGGLVWLKNRTGGSGPHNWYTTAIGSASYLDSSQTSGLATYQEALSTYNSNGFSLSSGAAGGNENTFTYASWSWAKAPKFFDVVTYTGTGSARTVAHNLGSVPGCIIVKATSAANDWLVYHTSLGNTQGMSISSTSAAATSTTYWNNTSPTSTQFTVGTSPRSNENGTTFVAYLFAHDAGGFGLTGTDNVISCGGVTANGSGDASISLGYEPQWLLTKRTDDVGNWELRDTMRGFGTASGFVTGALLRPNTSGAEASPAGGFYLTSTGFEIGNGMPPNATYIYIAIRRGPMKVPTDATKVFKPVATTPSGSGATTITTNFPVDLLLTAQRSHATSGINFDFDRLRGTTTTATRYLNTNATSAETSVSGNGFGFDSNTSVSDLFMNAYVGIGSSCIYWNFQRAPSFFDEVCYTGNSTSGRSINHNLTVVPQLMIVKNRTSTADWAVFSYFNDQYLLLNLTNSASGLGLTANSTTFNVGSGTTNNASGDNYVAYLFATCAGVSKVFSYTGNGSSQTINCGFTGGARWILIKRTDSTGDWYCWDSARGIVSGNDPHLSLNTTAAEVTSDDTIDTDSTGFVVNQVSATNVNVSSATYIGIAIA